jgi:ABC-type ATPase with predicted acetyltransferase domain
MHDDLSETVVKTDPGPYKRPLSLISSIYVERGCAEDWNAMKALHYKAHDTGVGPIFTRCLIEHKPGVEETIGALVLAVPKVLDAGRNEVFPNLKPNQDGIDTKLMQSMRVKWMNRNIRSGSRNVVDTMYRSAGIGYRLCNLAFRMSGFRYLETRASMTRFNPFATKAGMRFVSPKTAPALEAGIEALTRNFKSPPYDYAAILEELETMPDYARVAALRDIREFYYKHSAMEKSGEKRLAGRSRVATLPVAYLIKQVMQITFASTVYSVYRNPDYGRKLPDRIPITAFDNQPTDEPLRLDLL